MSLSQTLVVFGSKYLIWIAVAYAAYLFFRLSGEDKKRIVRLSIVVLPVAYLAALAAGHAYYDPRPFVVGHFAPLIPHADDNGFPSDHALLLSAVAAVFFAYDRKGSWALWVFALLVGLSRVLAGVHHPIDILGSMVISAVVAWIAHKSIGAWVKGRTAPQA